MFLALLRAEVEQAARLAQTDDDKDLPDLRFAEVKIDFSYAVQSSDSRQGVQILVASAHLKGLQSEQLARMSLRLKDADLLEMEVEAGRNDGDDVFALHAARHGV